MAAGGYMVMAGVTTKYVFDLQPGDVYWCTADCGWITGHTYLTYGPLLNGAQNVIFEGVPTYPDPSRCWQIVEKHKVKLDPSPSGLYTAGRFVCGWEQKCRSRTDVRQPCICADADVMPCHAVRCCNVPRCALQCGMLIDCCNSA